MVKEKREQQIIDNLALVHAVANRFRSRGVDYEDLFQAGCIGLIKAVDRFDDSLGYCFSTYAVPVIMGEIRHIFRDGGMIKVSRSLKDKSVKVIAARERYLKKYDREPTLSELTELTQLDADTLCEVLNVISPVLSLSDSEDESGLERDVPVDNSDELFDRLSVSEALGTLSKKDRLLIKYRFYEGKTQCETAKLLGISQVQVSRRERLTLTRLKEKMQY